MTLSPVQKAKVMRALMNAHDELDSIRPTVNSDKETYDMLKNYCDSLERIMAVVVKA